MVVLLETVLVMVLVDTVTVVVEGVAWVLTMTVDVTVLVDGTRVRVVTTGGNLEEQND